MPRSLRRILGYEIEATDGSLGTVHDFLFHDDDWKIRYLVVDTGYWLPGRKVLIAAPALGEPEERKRKFPVALSKEQVRRSPPIDLDQPVSRRYELELHEHYSWPFDWTLVEPRHDLPPEYAARKPRSDPHLRSFREVEGYALHARDGKIGHVEDMLADSSWAARYLVLDTGGWLGGKKVIVAVGWVQDIRWLEREIDVDLTRDEVRGSPPYDPSRPLEREEEKRLHEHYGRPAYWV